MTLRVAFGLIALCVLVLFYVATYRSTRSAFSAWWLLSLAAYLSSSVLFLLNGTPVQAVANPAGNLFGVAGSACVWAAASSLRDRRPPRPGLLVPPLLVFVASLLDDPAHDVWAGGTVFLTAMSAYYALGTRELWLLWRVRPRGGRADTTYDAAISSMAVSSALVALFYFLRLCVFTTAGPDSVLFTHYVGAQTTTLLLLVLLVVVTFNMSALAQYQLTRELQLAAMRDPLTGLLNRAGFQRRTDEVLAKASGPCGYVVMSDFDDFKLLNDHYGHATGDAVLAAFGAACQAELRPDDVAGRVGGDEFVLLLANGSDDAVERTLGAISKRLAEGAARGAYPLPSVSFGVAPLDPEAGLDTALARADAALYRAKRSGFGHVVRAD